MMDLEYFHAVQSMLRVPGLGPRLVGWLMHRDDVWLSVMFSRLPERYPNFYFGLGENDMGSLPRVLEGLDDTYENQADRPYYAFI